MRNSFNHLAGALAFLVLSVLSVHPAAAHLTEENPEQAEMVETCQIFTAPLSSSNVIKDRHNAAHHLAKEIKSLKRRDGDISDTKEKIDALADKKDGLLAQNILEGIRQEFTRYSGWDTLAHKLEQNGIHIDRVCLSPMGGNMPVAVYADDPAHAELNINFFQQESRVLPDGHISTTLSGKPLEEIEAELTPRIANQAVYYATLFGTANPIRQAHEKNYDAEDLAMLLTIWRALAAVEQIFHAADYFIRSGGDIQSFDAAYDTQPYQRDLVARLNWKATTQNRQFSPEEHAAIKRFAVMEALKNPVVRRESFRSIYDNLDDPDTAFTHTPSAEELRDVLNHLDPAIADMPVREIYTHWQTSKNDPAAPAKKDIADYLRDFGTKERAAPFPAQPSPAS